MRKLTQGEAHPCQNSQECRGRRVHPQDRPDCRPHQEPPQAECQRDRVPAKSCLTQLLAEVDWDPNKALPHGETAGRFNQDQDITQIEERGRGKSPEAAELRTNRGDGRWISKNVNTRGPGGQSEPSGGGILPKAQCMGGREIRGTTKAQETGKRGPGPTSPRTGQEGRRELEP